MNRGDSNLGCSIGCAPYMFILFLMALTLLLLKLAGVIDWLWWVVLLPAAIFVAPPILVLATALLLTLLLRGWK